MENIYAVKLRYILLNNHVSHNKTVQTTGKNQNSSKALKMPILKSKRPNQMYHCGKCRPQYPKAKVLLCQTQLKQPKLKFKNNQTKCMIVGNATHNRCNQKYDCATTQYNQMFN